MNTKAPESDATPVEPIAAERELFGMSRDRVELIATIVLAAAAIFTAWSAFQSGKWSGVQAVSFSEAGAARTESTRFATLAGQQAQVDIALFVDWASALNDEVNDGVPVLSESGDYTPVEGTLSNFLFTRMRDEAVVAIEAWLLTDPLTSSGSPANPFIMDEYVLAAQQEAERLRSVAEEKAAAAREANQTGDSYVLTAVMFATVLFFGGISSKLERRRNRYIALSIGILILLLATVLVFSLPIELGDEFFFAS